MPVTKRATILAVILTIVACSDSGGVLFIPNAAPLADAGDAPRQEGHSGFGDNEWATNEQIDTEGPPSGASSDELIRYFASYLSDKQSCQGADDCALLDLSCPLGCSAAVSAGALQDAAREANRLTQQWEQSGGRTSQQGCFDQCSDRGFTCNNGRCLTCDPGSSGCRVPNQNPYEPYQ